MFVKTRMTSNPFTVTPDTTVPEALEIMVDKSVRHLPVMRDGKLVGVLSRGDIAAAGPSSVTSFSVGELTYLMNKLKVGQVMSRHLITTTPDALLEQAAVLMRDHGVEMLPVLDGERLVGVITESTIVDAFVELLGFRDPGIRLAVEAPDAPGMLSLLAGITAKYGANISHLAIYRGDGDHSTIVFGMNSQDTSPIEQELADHGFRILARLHNPQQDAG